MNIGYALKKARQIKGLNQSELAEATGFTQSYLSQIENDHRYPSLEALETIGKALDTPIQILLWFSLERSDVQDEKRQVFDIIKPFVDKAIEQLI